MTEQPDEHPTHREGGVPEFVRVYDSIRSLVEKTSLDAGERLPGEDALSAELDVPRRLVQEALLLLEEDGYLTRDRDRQRVVAARQRSGVGFADSFHRVLVPTAEPSRRLHASVEETSSFTRDLFRGDPGALVWETVFTHRDHQLAATLEFMRLDALPDGMADDVDATRHDVRAQPTILEALGPERRARLVPILWRLAPIARSTERLSWMDLALHAIPAGLTLVLAEDGLPVYVAKNIFDLGTFSLAVDMTGPDETGPDETGPDETGPA